MCWIGMSGPDSGQAMVSLGLAPAPKAQAARSGAGSMPVAHDAGPADSKEGAMPATRLQETAQGTISSPQSQTTDSGIR